MVQNPAGTRSPLGLLREARQTERLRALCGDGELSFGGDGDSGSFERLDAESASGATLTLADFADVDGARGNSENCEVREWKGRRSSQDFQSCNNSGNCKNSWNSYESGQGAGMGTAGRAEITFNGKTSEIHLRSPDSLELTRSGDSDRLPSRQNATELK